MIKIFITDDHPIVRDGLISILEAQEDFMIVGEASNGPETIARLEKDPADILFLDLAMPEMDGVKVIEALREKDIPTKVIVFTVFDSDERIIQAVKAGAKGYLLKGAKRQEIFAAIRTVHEGGSLVQPLVISKLFQHISGETNPLTQRELEVLSHVAEGLSNKQIGERLFISERTVKFHVSAILGKLGAQNRTDAVRLAREQGLIDLS